MGLVEGYKVAQGIWEVATVVAWLWVLCGLCSSLGNPSTVLHPLSFLLGETTSQCCAKHRNKSPGNGDMALGFS